MTSTASASGLLAKVLIPSENKLLAVLRNERVKFAQFCAAKTARFGQSDGFQPELCVTFRFLHVDMPGLAPFSTEKEEAETANSKDFWHGGANSGDSKTYSFYTS